MRRVDVEPDGALARRVEGTVVAPEVDDLGAAVVGSYLSGRWGRWGQDPGEQVWPA